MSDDQPLLSGEETDALLDAMRASEGKQEASIDAVDLTTPDRGLRDALSYADQAAEKFGHVGHKVFLRSLGVSTNFEPEPTEITPFDVFRTAIPEGAAVAVLQSSSGAQAVLLVGPALVQAVLDRRLGAPIRTASEDDEESAPEAGSLSAVDRRILRPFLEGVTGAFGQAWCRPGTSISLGNIVGRPDQMPAIDRAEPVLRLGFRIAPGANPSDRMHVVIPSAFLFDTGPHSKEEVSAASVSDKRKVIGRIQGAGVDLSAVLGTAKSTVGQVLGLKVGDVVRLSTVAGGPVALAVSGRHLAQGQPMIQHGNLAVEVISISQQREA